VKYGVNEISSNDDRWMELTDSFLDFTELLKSLAQGIIVSVPRKTAK
jgi:hypothetical protein